MKPPQTPELPQTPEERKQWCERWLEYFIHHPEVVKDANDLADEEFEAMLKKKLPHGH